MFKVLTVDFDTIMADCIELYNDLIYGAKSIDGILQKYPQLSYMLTADLFIYDGLTRLLMKYFKTLPATQVFFISDHHKVIKLTEDLDKFSLYNIDHHHDIAYHPLTATSKIINPDCGNWVKYLRDKGKIESYTWICNDTSSKPDKIMRKGYLDNMYLLKEYNLDQIGKVDRLIICNSPQWIPPNIQALFLSWIGIAEEYYGKDFKLN